MALIETWLNCDTTKMVTVKALDGNVFSADNEGNLLGVYVSKKGQPVELSGSVIGYVIRPDGETVAVPGSLSGNRAWIVLPQSAYAVVGQISIAIRLVSGSEKTVLAACTGYVNRTTTDTIIDPGHVIPSLEELLAQIEACETATTAATTAAGAANTAASNADAKAALANTAAGNADAKATLANEAAGRADDAAASLENMTATATGLAAGASPTVNVMEEDGHYLVEFGIPKGDTGEVTQVEFDDLKSALKQSDNELFRVSGYLNQNYVKGRQRYVDAGVEKFANNSRWISPAQGKYIELKSGDMIVVHQSDRYHFRVCYSTDNKATFSMSSEQTTRFSMPSDAIGWISIVTTTTATDDDVETILNEHIIEILRNDVNLVAKAVSTANGIVDALEINPNSGFNIEAIKNGTTFVYVNTTATENGGNEKLFEISCAKDDVLRIKFDFQAMLIPENFSDCLLAVREIDQNEASPLRNEYFYLSELQTAAEFTVRYANTKKIIANVNLKRSNTTVLTGYYEEIKYSITVIKVLEQNDVYTEAGEAWEV